MLARLSLALATKTAEMELGGSQPWCPAGHPEPVSLALMQRRGLVPSQGQCKEGSRREGGNLKIREEESDTDWEVRTPGLRLAQGWWAGKVPGSPESRRAKGGGSVSARAGTGKRWAPHGPHHPRRRSGSSLTHLLSTGDLVAEAAGAKPQPDSLMCSG